MTSIPSTYLTVDIVETCKPNKKQLYDENTNIGNCSLTGRPVYAIMVVPTEIDLGNHQPVWVRMFYPNGATTGKMTKVNTVIVYNGDMHGINISWTLDPEKFHTSLKS
jgi:hypothetical protein